MSLLHSGTWCRDVWWVYRRSTSLDGTLSKQTCDSRTRQDQIRSLQFIAFAAHSLMSGGSIVHVVKTTPFIRWVQLWQVKLTRLDIGASRLQPITEKAAHCTRCNTVAIDHFLFFKKKYIYPSLISSLVFRLHNMCVSLTQTKKITVNVCGYHSWPFCGGPGLFRHLPPAFLCGGWVGRAVIGWLCPP